MLKGAGMKKMAALSMILGLVALGLLAGRTAFADDSIVDRAGKGIKKGGEAAGRGIEKGAKAVEPGIEKGGKAAVKGIKKGGEWMGLGLKKTGEKLEKADKT
jgi:hypothetical protein